MSKTISNRTILILAVAALTLLGLGPVVAAHATPAKAAKHNARHGAKPNHAGVVLGGVTPEGLPVAIQVSPDGREVVQMAMAVSLTCQQGGQTVIVPATYKHVPISASGAFQDSMEGSGSEGSGKGTVTGRFNQAMTTITTTWTMTVTVHSATVNDTCTGSVSFTAIQ